jgi:hypothetical protein
MYYILREAVDLHISSVLFDSKKNTLLNLGYEFSLYQGIAKFTKKSLKVAACTEERIYAYDT